MSETARFPSETVLVVDDEESVRRTFREWLVSSDLGVNVVSAADAESALVQVGSAVGFAGRQAQHGHGRLVAIEDDSNIGNALVGDRLKSRMEPHALLNDRSIGQCSQRIHAGQNV